MRSLSTRPRVVTLAGGQCLYSLAMRTSQNGDGEVGFQVCTTDVIVGLQCDPRCRAVSPFRLWADLRAPSMLGGHAQAGASTACIWHVAPA